MKLSEAIRLGAMLKPQAFGDFTDGVGTCAIGAANEAIGLPANDEDTMPAGWSPIFDRTSDTACPECHRHCFESVIIHLNDEHRWTREQIADWVDTIERAQETPDPSCGATEQALSTEALTPAVAHSAPE